MDSTYIIHVDTMYFSASFYERPIEEITVITDEYGGSGLLDMFKEAHNDIVLLTISMRVKKLTYLELTSFASLKIVKGPSISGFGLYSKSSMSSLTISRFVIKYP